MKTNNLGNPIRYEIISYLRCIL